jgi:hypothetical protein
MIGLSTNNPEPDKTSGFARALVIGGLAFILVVLFVTHEITKKNTIPTTPTTTQQK